MVSHLWQGLKRLQGPGLLCIFQNFVGLGGAGLLFGDTLGLQCHGSRALKRAPGSFRLRVGAGVAIHGILNAVAVLLQREGCLFLGGADWAAAALRRLGWSSSGSTE